MASVQVQPYARDRIARVAEAALIKAGAAGVFPTPIEAVQRAVGVDQRLDISTLPADLSAKKPAVMKRILGAFVPAEKTIFVDGSQRGTRVLFTDAHETMHAACLWHEPTLRLDSANELFNAARLAEVEAEANFGAAALIFQNGRFHRRALEDQVSLSVPIALSGAYGASMHAAIRYYVEEHPDRVALLITGVRESAVGTIPVWHSIESRSFAARYGPLVQQTAPAGVSLREGADAPFAEIIDSACRSSTVHGSSMTLMDLGRKGRRCHAEAFSNGRNHFVMVSERSARILGRRTTVVSSA